jgi:hypothetical protein
MPLTVEQFMRWSEVMDLLLIIIVLVLLFGGGGFYGYRRWR